MHHVLKILILLPLLAAGCTPPADVAVEQEPVTEEVRVEEWGSLDEIERQELTADPLPVEEAVKMVPTSLMPSSMEDEKKVEAGTENKPTPQAPKPQVVTPPTPAPVVKAPSCQCPDADLDCKDFDTHDEAQAVHDCCMATEGWDVHRLDGNDNDGLACESLP